MVNSVVEASPGLCSFAGKKTGKASLKVWQFGEMSLRTISDAIDYGQAASLTRMGTIGESACVSSCILLFGSASSPGA